MLQLTFALGFYFIGLLAIRSQPKGKKRMGFVKKQTEKLRSKLEQFEQ